jgi:hypothetical protein
MVGDASFSTAVSKPCPRAVGLTGTARVPRYLVLRVLDALIVLD